MNHNSSDIVRHCVILLNRIPKEHAIFEISLISFACLSGLADVSYGVG